MTVEGYDLSHWDGINEYSLAGKGFVIIKVTEGSGYVDPAFDDHLKRAMATPGVLIGAYHYARDDNSIDGQAKWFVQHVPAAVTFLAVDNEGANIMTDPQCTALIAAIRKYDLRDRPILLYMSDSGFMGCGQDYNWVAKWSTTPPSRPYLIWQYKSGSQAGSGGEDRDRYPGTQAQLAAILGGGASTGGSVNTYSVPKVPTEIRVDANDTLWPNDACDPADPSRIIVSPSRYMPFLGVIPGGASGRDIVEYVDDKGVHSGKSYFAPHGSLGPTRPIAMTVDDGYTKATQDAAVAAQKAADDAACAKATSDAAVKAAADQAAADQAALDAANAALATAAETERKRIAAAEAVRINSI